MWLREIDNVKCRVNAVKCDNSVQRWHTRQLMCLGFCPHFSLRSRQISWQETTENTGKETATHTHKQKYSYLLAFNWKYRVAQINKLSHSHTHLNIWFTFLQGLL